MQIGDPKQPTDLDLIRRVVDRDEGALAALYDRYGGLVYSVVKHVLGDAGAAEEILQDIFYQLWRTASKFDSSRGSLPAWLLVTARNRAIDRLRRRSRSADVSANVEPTSVALTSSLEAVFSQNEAMARVKAALSALPKVQLEAIELAYFEGLTQSEIAERTSEPLGTIKTRLRTALQSLKKVLNP